jgi:hypothetical protein
MPDIFHGVVPFVYDPHLLSGPEQHLQGAVALAQYIRFGANYRHIWRHIV